MTQPTPAEQLLNLADRAERHQLTGPEAARLRESISQLYGLFERYRDRSNEYADRYLKQRERAERAEAAIRDAAPTLRRALDCLDATCRYHGDRLDPDEYGRRSRAEACCDTGIEPRRAREATAALNRLLAALDEHQEQPRPPVHVGGNAEDCPACEGTNPPYPFLCPGPTNA